MHPEGYYVGYDDMCLKLNTMLNFSPKEGVLALQDERFKTEPEGVIIEQVKNQAIGDMKALNRSKIMDLPSGLIHVVPKGKKAKYSSRFLKGIVVERTINGTKDECLHKVEEGLFKAMLYRELFYRMCDSVVVVDKSRRIFLADDGLDVLKKGLASLMAKKFIREKDLPKSVEGAVVDVFSEGVFSTYLKEYSINKNLSEDKAFNIFSEAVVNGIAFPLIMLSKKRFDPGESIAMLNWIRVMDGKIPFAN
ncbi:MAG: hypothetical protein PHS95_03515 [Candidatus Pacebacteria bacterium]|nr:hypothetical protein [Candidatus Paceibacterota bacterium]